jgi:hypothetical protein
MVKHLHIGAGQALTLHFHYPASTEQVSRFQDVQLAVSGDACSYHITVNGP